MIPVVRPFRGTLDETRQVYDSLAPALKALQKVAIVDGRLINSVTVKPSGTTVVHGLDRVPRGWIVVDRKGSSDVWRVSWNEQNIRFASAAEFEASFWIF